METSNATKNWPCKVYHSWTKGFIKIIVQPFKAENGAERPDSIIDTTSKIVIITKIM